MDYFIKERVNNKGELCTIGIDFEPENNVLSALFSSIRIEQFPDFITDISNSKSTGYEPLSLRMYNDIDWEDQAWIKSVMHRNLQKGEVFVSVYKIGETIIPESVLDKILYNYGSNILDVFHKNSQVQEKYIEYYNHYDKENHIFKENLFWVKAMKDSLLKLSQKMINPEY
ncbi:hypothetical protein [Flavobacterium sp. Root420]|uniref:hypothetical protein n=1 Tax=Flavobacterium sp. Root420 TaxID=1736533 RepID=UPI0006F51E9A|nr:hypothetical protein [Flavobacterium sp. Root420]KQW99028.1 hypothetical protein ASC72_12980 [Flavobacterium sp. Root420]